MEERSFAALKERHRAIREGFSRELDLRVHRALSWLERAELEVERGDDDAAFIFHWIAFNAAYAGDMSGDAAPNERSVFRDYFRILQLADRRRVIYGAIWQKFAGPIRELMKNPYVFGPFWDAQASGNADAWRGAFDGSQNTIRTALERQDTQRILEVIFDRLYVLRNQLLHGGATWRGSVNRDQVRDGERILGFMVPVFIGLMMEAPDADWGKTRFPVIP